MGAVLLGRLSFVCHLEFLVEGWAEMHCDRMSYCTDVLDLVGNKLKKKTALAVSTCPLWLVLLCLGIA